MSEWEFIKKKKKSVTKQNKEKEIQRKENKLKYSNQLNKADKKRISNEISSIDDDIDEFSLQSVKALQQKVLNAVKSLKLSYYFNNILDTLIQINIDFGTIVSLGIGQFSKSPSALLQLAIAICLGEELKLMTIGNNNNSDINNNSNSCSSNSYIFDPMFTENEKYVCKRLGFIVSEENKRGKHNVKLSGKSDELIVNTLFFMPHCPYRLYCNLLWENWLHLNHIVIFGNSFTSYDLRRVYVEATDADCVHILLPLVTEIPINNEENISESINNNNKCEESRIIGEIIPIPIDYSVYMENAFNDLSIHFFLNSLQLSSTSRLKQRPSLESINIAADNDIEMK
jgi:hypothetical protein